MIRISDAINKRLCYNYTIGAGDSEAEQKNPCTMASPSTFGNSYDNAIIKISYNDNKLSNEISKSNTRVFFSTSTTTSKHGGKPQAGSRNSKAAIPASIRYDVSIGV